MNAAKDPGLTEGETDIFSIIERATSVFSFLGSLFVIGSFCFSKAFHKPINRLVFYATFGNLMTNVATLMATSFIGNITSAGCKFQAFLIQMFMPADAYWTLAMALNVYLTFYFKFDAHQLRRMELPYLLLCYGIPFIVAFTLIFISSPEKGPMYGNATLWCWISPKWDIYRIATFYGPVWIIILITFFIYIRAGREIYKKHKQLRDFSTSHHDPEPFPALDDLFSSVKTTEVYVTTEVVDKGGAIDLGPLGNAGAGAGRRSSQISASHPKPPKAAYSVTISAHQRHESQGDDLELPIQPNITNHTIDTQISSGTTATNGNKIRRGGHALTTTTSSSNNPNKLRRRAAWEANNATWSYAKCAILFFTAMLVTWIPSSANRVYSLAHAGHASLALEYMSAFVLPLQGFWNSIIYTVTSWGACKMLWEDVCSWWSCFGAGSRRRNRRGESGMPNPVDLVPGLGHLHRHGSDNHHHHGHRSTFHMGMGRSVTKGSDAKMYETESMTELAGCSRPASISTPGTPAEPEVMHGAKDGER